MKKKFDLGVFTFFKNEGHVIHEWIHHYRKWGVQHIWLVDNGSSDKYNIQHFIDEGFVTVWKETTGSQTDAYWKYIGKIKKEVHWLGVFDMDEFLYSKEHPTLLDAIQSIQSSHELNKPPLHMIKIQMKIFLPGTFVSPTSVIQLNTVVKGLDSANHPKCLYNMNYIEKVTIHGYQDPYKSPSQNVYFIDGNQSILCINHYRYGSFEYLYGIKEERGGGEKKQKYKNHVILTSTDSDNDTSYITDKYLKEKSDIWQQHIQPGIHLYPNSSWIFLKKNFPDKYDEFCHMNDNNNILSAKQIHEITKFLTYVRDTQRKER